MITEKLELTDEQIEIILSLGKTKNSTFFSILDIPSFERLKKYKLKIIKIPSTISVDNKYLNYIVKNYKDEIVLSTGMTNKNYLQKTAHLFKENKKDIYVTLRF